MIDFFYSKSLIKLVKNRIDVIRRKRNATQKFLKKDIADLLSNGLDINAYGRVIIYWFFFNLRVIFFFPKKMLKFYEVAFSAVLECLEILGLLIFFFLILYRFKMWMLLSWCFCNVMKQADGLLAELNVSFCYDFVEQCCDFVYKSLSVMQRLRYEWSGSTAIIAQY